MPRVVRDAQIDWVRFDAQLARDGSVSANAKALYAALSSFANLATHETPEDSFDPADYPTRKTLASCIGASPKTVDRAIRELEEYGIVEVVRRRDPDNPELNLPNVYRLLDHVRWDERAAARVAKRSRSEGGVTSAPPQNRTEGDESDSHQSGVGSPAHQGGAWVSPLPGLKKSSEVSSSSYSSSGVDEAPEMPSAGASGEEEERRDACGAERHTTSESMPGCAPAGLEGALGSSESDEDEIAAYVDADGFHICNECWSTFTPDAGQDPRWCAECG